MFIKHLLYTRLSIHLLESSRLLSLLLLSCSPAGTKCLRQQGLFSEAALPLLPTLLPPGSIAALSLLLPSLSRNFRSFGLCPYLTRRPSFLPRGRVWEGLGPGPGEAHSAFGAGGLMSNSHHKVGTDKPVSVADSEETQGGALAVV